MNIGYFIRRDWFPPAAGSGVHAYQVASNLIQRGHTISCIFSPTTDPSVRLYEPRQVLRFIRDIDLIYIRIFGALQMGKFGLLKWLRRRGCPVVWELNAPLEEMLLTGQSPRHVARLQQHCRWLATWLDGCICNTQMLADYAVHNWRSKNNFVIPLGSDPQLFTPRAQSAATYGEQQERFKVVWAGTPQYRWHGLPLILDVARQIDTVDRDVVFILIGKRRHFEKYGSLPRNVIVVDAQPYFDMPQFFASADLGLCLYERQPPGVDFYRSPLKLFDSMASGIPSIVTSERETRRIVRHGENSLLVDNRPEQIIDCILAAKRDPSWARQMGKQARRDVKQFYNWRRVAEQTEAALASLL